jgi:hypothetical protein
MGVNWENFVELRRFEPLTPSMPYSGRKVNGGQAIPKRYGSLLG